MGPLCASGRSAPARRLGNKATARKVWHLFPGAPRATGPPPIGLDHLGRTPWPFHRPCGASPGAARSPSPPAACLGHRRRRTEGVRRQLQGFDRERGRHGELGGAQDDPGRRRPARHGSEPRRPLRLRHRRGVEQHERDRHARATASRAPSRSVRRRTASRCCPTARRCWSASTAPTASPSSTPRAAASSRRCRSPSRTPSRCGPDGKLAYVASQEPGTFALVVVDLATRAVARRIDLDKPPRDPEFSHDGRYLYVTIAGVNALRVIDAATDKPVAEIATGAVAAHRQVVRRRAGRHDRRAGPGRAAAVRPGDAGAAAHRRRRQAAALDGVRRQDGVGHQRRLERRQRGRSRERPDDAPSRSATRRARSSSSQPARRPRRRAAISIANFAFAPARSRSPPARR